jgi:hypothetical protein
MKGFKVVRDKFYYNVQNRFKFDKQLFACRIMRDCLLILLVML